MRRVALGLMVLGTALLLLGAVGAGGVPAAATWDVTPLPPPASAEAQLQDGEGLYKLYCSTCHGDRLYGLDEAWLAQWDPERRNCWQSKCHIENYPPDGFILPRVIPPLAGPGSLTKFGTAADLHAFINIRMPFQEPGRLTEDEYWAMAAYILRHNDIGLGGGILTAANAGSVLLRQAEPPSTATPPPAAMPLPTPVPHGWTYASATAAAAAAVVGVFAGGVLVLRRRPRPPAS